MSGHPSPEKSLSPDKSTAISIPNGPPHYFTSPQFIVSRRTLALLLTPIYSEKIGH